MTRCPRRRNASRRKPGKEVRSSANGMAYGYRSGRVRIKAESACRP
ncbi:hypothetical protein KCP77_23880 [Salmonella enterica subsp. enterica]|nr:hypothetical protein KCP77_23880 [Salmonella enterica subsp. enterica]